jgi:hypothetical protein
VVVVLYSKLEYSYYSDYAHLRQLLATVHALNMHNTNQQFNQLLHIQTLPNELPQKQVQKQPRVQTHPP